jgi:glycogen debranching enzyme
MVTYIYILRSDDLAVMKLLNKFHFCRFSLHENVTSALSKLHKHVTNFTTKKASSNSELEVIVSRLTLADLNRALYRCEEEERDETKGASGAYDIPDFGPVVYCGLQGKYSQYSESVQCCC